jgi:hypothetical protein
MFRILGGLFSLLFRFFAPDQKHMKRWTPTHKENLRWMCTGCGMGGSSSSEKGRRLAADAHAAEHGYEFPPAYFTDHMTERYLGGYDSVTTRG